MNKFNYFFSAVLYSIWKMEIRFDEIVTLILYFLLFDTLKCILPSKFRDSLDRRKKACSEFLSNMRYNPRRGSCIGNAMTFFSLMYCCYPLIITFSAFGLVVRYTHGNIHPILSIPFAAIPVLGAWWPIRRAILDNDKYLKYFRKFDNKDKHWHKKWKLIATAFCVGSISSFALAMYLFFAIAIGRFDFF